ncbi:DNA-binding domain-containing protein [Zavarzinia compransoris]|uniref:HvfC/BufC family peptide modification chaperone n=1 Tax=Zavarzinia marina TaxID=2911065 RepID=UPI001F4630C6|nr:putative DNA-binding domain-containing protein [Zavarzinia marina]MCF4164147.1 DNA-binding domain-containing protein [Zavarzinia marina]
MSGLRELQRRFAADLLGGAPVIEEMIDDAARAPRPTMAGVYRHAYGGRLVDVLAADFPVTLALMGSAEFAAAARGYVARHPSRTPSIRWLGRHLAGDLRDQGALAGADMAGFEWALGLAFDAAPGGTVAMETLAALTPGQWEGLVPVFQPGFSMVAVEHAVQDGWAAHQAGQAPAAPTLEAPVRLLVWRFDLDVRYRVATAAEAALLDALGNATGFGAAVGASALEPQAAIELLAGWCLSGIVGALRLPHEDAAPAK